jgi:Tfp pilus assembly protein FimV
MLEEASAQVAQQAEALTKLGSDSDEKAAELKSAQAQLSTAIASLDTANADLAEQTELISSLKVENTGEASCLFRSSGRGGLCVLNNC